MALSRTPERDGASIGRGAGSLLADTLTQLLDARSRRGARPSQPMGASRIGNELRRVIFHGGVAEAGAWLQTPGLVDAFVLYVPADDDEIRILVPSLAATSFDIVWRLRFALDDDGVFTSEPGFTVAEGMDELLDDFNDGIAAGLELHPRTAEIRPGFGALGPYDDDASA